MVMTVDGINYRLTKHGYKRAKERLGITDQVAIILACLNNSKAVWKKDRQEGMRLITVLE